jgi:hypothetical protein
MDFLIAFVMAVLMFIGLLNIIAYFENKKKKE